MSSIAATYKNSGVDIDTANDFIRKIKPLVKKTERPEVLSSIGHYAGLFALNKDQYKNPVLVASTDGVGTKLKLALEWEKLDGLGQDLVAMSANDILCLGAEPLFFLDYFAVGKLEIKTASVLVEGIAKACQEIHCALLGGETAEMPKLYRGGDFDLAGFIVGIVEREEIIDGSRIQIGDQVIGLSSSGFHSNGYSLVRKVVGEKKLSPDKKYPPLRQPLRDLLLEPTRLYVKTVRELKRSFKLNGIAHITGGGLVENLPRLFPDHCGAVLHQDFWPRPPIFQLIQKWGKIAEEEMHRVFNCGIGLMLVVPANEADDLLQHLQNRNEKAWIIGEIVERKKGMLPLEIL
jgi:phosphoribosylformylglycinamidine cyclo-ligase